MIAGRLEIEMAANVARLSQDMQQARGVVGNAMQGIEASVARAKAALGALGIGIGIGALVAMAKATIDAADKLTDLSKSTGIAVEQLSGLRIAAKQSGSDLDGVAASINKLSVNMGQSGEKFAALGVTAKEPLEAFKQLADRFSAIQDPQLRAALGAEALGKSWAAAAPLLAEGGAKIGEMVEKGQKLSGVTKEMAEQSDAFNDKLVLLTGTSGGLNRAIGPLLPLLNTIADELLKAQEASAKLGGSDFKPLLEAGKAIVVLFGNVAFVFKGIGNDIGNFAAQLSSLATGDFKRSMEIGRQLNKDTQAARVAFDAWEKSIMDVGSASKSTAKDIDTMDQVTRRMISTAEAAAREFIEFEKRKKEAEAAAKKAAEDAFKARVASAEAEQKANDMFAQDYAEAWKFADEARLKEFNEDVRIRMDLMDAENKANEMFAQDYAEAWKFANEFQRDEDKKTADAAKQNLAVWDDIADRGARFFDDLIFSGKKAFDSLKDFLKSFARDLISLFARRWILSLGANATGSGDLASVAASAGGSTLAGSVLSAGAGGLWAAGSNFVAGMSLPAAAVGAGAIEAGVGVAAGSAAGIGSTFATAMMAIPVWGWIIAGLATIAAILSSRKGGPKDEGQFITGGAPGFNIVGTSANGATQQFATGLATQIAQTLASFGASGSFQVGAGIVRDPSGTSPTFVDTLLRSASGQEILRQHNANVGRSDEEMQAELVLQSQRVILAALQASELPKEVSDILNSLVASTASGEDINRVIAAALEMKQVMDALAKLGVPGLNIAALKLMQREGEKLSETFNSVAAGMQAFYQEFFSEEERRIMLESQLREQFKALGLELPASREAFRALIEGLDLTDAAQAQLYRSLIELAPAFAQLIPIVDGVAEAVDQVNEIIEFANRQILPIDYWQTIQGMAETLINDFSKYNTVIGEQPTKMGGLSLQSTLLSQTVSQYQAQLAALLAQSSTTGQPLTPQYYALEIALETLRKQLTATGMDIARLTILEAQYGEEKGEALLELEKWYETQKALIGTNQTALDALKVLFDTKWQEILDGVASTSALSDAKARLGEWWQSLFLNEKLSPLTLQQRFAEAQTQYQTTLSLAQGGDVNAISNLSGISQTVLELGRQLLASSPAYTELFRQIAEQTGSVAGLSQADINSKLYGALPTSSTIASSADISGLRDAIYDVIAMFTNGDAIVQTPDASAALDELKTEVQAASSAGVLA